MRWDLNPEFVMDRNHDVYFSVMRLRRLDSKNPLLNSIYFFNESFCIDTIQPRSAYDRLPPIHRIEAYVFDLNQERKRIIQELWEQRRVRMARQELKDAA